jgi:hypothetical protein
MKQTAVEYLVEQLNEIGFHTIVIQSIIDKAKAMEKEQIEYAYVDGYNRAAKILEDATKQNGLNLNI